MGTRKMAMPHNRQSIPMRTRQPRRPHLHLRQRPTKQNHKHKTLLDTQRPRRHHNKHNKKRTDPLDKKITIKIIPLGQERIATFKSGIIEDIYYNNIIKLTTNIFDRMNYDLEKTRNLQKILYN